MSLKTAFDKRVVKSEGCWEWSGEIHNKYGRFEFEHNGTIYRMRAHRVSWALNNGPIPKGLCVLHKCDNPPCVRPDHLFLGTQQDNHADMMSKGRNYSLPKGVLPPAGQAVKNKAKTECPKCKGPLLPVMLSSQGNRRRCPPCTQTAKNAYLKRWREQRRHT